MNQNFTDIELFLVSEWIASHIGLKFNAGKWDMLRVGLASAAVDFGFQNRSGFINWLLTNQPGHDPVENLAPFLTVSETYFWREPKAFDALTQNALKELIASKKDHGKTLSVWCAACSTGEEAYSIAIALHRTIPGIQDWKITIHATDINAKALIKARAGIYGSWSFRNSPSWLKSGYFKQLNTNQYQVIPTIRKMVTFSSFNLTQEDYLTSLCKNHEMDIIFCRNALMYFTDEWAAKISRNLCKSLSNEGWLVVSSCELSSNLFPTLTPVNFPSAVIYQKRKRDAWTESDITAFNYPDPMEDFSLKTETYTPTEIIVPVAAEPLPRAKTRENHTLENKTLIRSLANQGLLNEALAICQEAIASDKLSPGLYFLQASILQELDKGHEAIRSLKQAIYIYPGYLMGHFTLGNLFFRQGNLKSSERYFNNALELLHTIPDHETPAEAEGLSALYIRGIIVANLLKQKVT